MSSMVLTCPVPRRAKATGKNVINQLKSIVGGTDVGGAAKQLGVGMVAGFAGVSANQLMALSKGKIFNPNVELLYDGPRFVHSVCLSLWSLRVLTRLRINEIVKEFKVWSAPKENGGMYKYLTSGRYSICWVTSKTPT